MAIFNEKETGFYNKLEKEIELENFILRSDEKQKVFHIVDKTFTRESLIDSVNKKKMLFKPFYSIVINKINESIKNINNKEK